MTIDELEQALNAMNDGEFERFRGDYGGGNITRGQYVDDFVHHPEKERRLCQVLGLKTEAEKMTDALLNSSAAAVTSAEASKKSANAAVIAVCVSVAAVVLSVIRMIE